MYTQKRALQATYTTTEKQKNKAKSLQENNKECPTHSIFIKKEQ